MSRRDVGWLMVAAAVAPAWNVGFPSVRYLVAAIVDFIALSVLGAGFRVVAGVVRRAYARWPARLMTVQVAASLVLAATVSAVLLVAGNSAGTFWLFVLVAPITWAVLTFIRPDVQRRS